MAYASIEEILDIHTSIEEILDILAAMRHQEETAYYLPVDFWSTTNHIQVDRSSRTAMAAWCQQVVEFCNFQPESAEIALSLADRFVLADPTVLHDSTTYQLACMTSLYTAVKTHEHAAMHPRVITQLSHGAYSVAQVEAMEQRILTAVRWRVHPPTATSFSRLLVDLLDKLSCFTNEQERSAALRLTLLQCEAAVVETTFMAIPSSTIAYAALINTWESLSNHCRPAEEQQASLDSITLRLQHALGRQHCPDTLCRVRACLFEALVGEHSTTTAVAPSLQRQPLCVPRPKPFGGRSTSESSPRSVALDAAAAPGR